MFAKAFASNKCLVSSKLNTCRAQQTKPGRMEESLEGGRGPPRAVEPLERESTCT